MNISVTDTLDEGLKKRNYQGGLPLSHLLSVFTYEKDGHYFHTEDGRFARMWKLPTFDMSAKGQADFYGRANALTKVITAWPQNATGQIIRYCHTDIRGHLNAFKSNLPEDADLFSKVFVDNVQFAF